MNYEHFGAFLQGLRTRHNFSREKLAENICTAKQIYRIEKGESEPSLYLITQLSIKFNMDLNEYFKMYFTCNSIIGLEGINAINDAIENNDLSTLNSLIIKYEKFEEFQKGENLQHIYYGKALYSALHNCDYNSSLEYCFKGLHIESPDFEIENYSNTMYSNIGIVLLNCISQNYFALNEFEKGMKVLTELLSLLEKYVINSPFPLFQSSQFSKKIYQVVLCNLSAHLLNHNEVDIALTYVNKGIEFSISENNISFLPDLYYMKLRILYYQEKYEESKEYYNRTIYLYKIASKENKLAELEETSKTDYPEIFKE